MTQAKVRELFAPESNMGIRIFTGGKDIVDMADLSTEEAGAVRYCFEKHVKFTENVSPKLAAGLRPQREAFVKWAAVAKGTFPEVKTMSYPGQPGGLGVDVLNPFNFRYLTYAGCGTTYGKGYNGYHDDWMNTWKTSLTKDTAKYLLGYDATYPQYYGAGIVNEKHSFVVIAQDGLLELSTEPCTTQIQWKSSLMDKYNSCSVGTLFSESIEEDRSIYQYPTPGMVPIPHTIGMTAILMPSTTQQSVMPLMGMCFYEYDFVGTGGTVRAATL